MTLVLQCCLCEKFARFNYFLDVLGDNGDGTLRSIPSHNLDPDECSDTDKAESVCSGTDDGIGKIFQENAIFIRALPSNISEQLLFDILWDEFTNNVGTIKVITRRSSRK